jgi:uncharacterized protein DUF6580
MNARSKWPALGLTAVGAVLRILPHPPNLAPVGAMSLFAGANLAGWQAYLVPLLLMAVTDPIIAAMGGFDPFSRGTIFIYGSFLISVWIGKHLRGSYSPARIGGAAFLCALQFFLITNFSTWMLSRMYPHTLAGLGACYVAALPFFGYTLIGNLFYSAFFFGAHYWLTRRQLVRA